MSSLGLDFVSFQVRDREASARFYEHTIGLTRLPIPNPHAVAFAAGRATFAVRDAFEGVDLDKLGQLGAGVAVWLHVEDTASVHARLVEADVPIVQEPFEGPFGLTFSFRDPDGYVVTIHANA